MASATRAEPVAAPIAKRRRRPGWILRGIGKTLLTAAVLLAAYIAWLLWGSGLYHGRQQDALRGQIETQIETAPQEAGRRIDPRPVPLGRAYAILEIPAIGLDEVVVQGTGTEELKKGPGHYPDTADPWQDSGRVGIAGHRTTYGQPFWNLDKIQPGDEIVLRTVAGDFSYVVTRSESVLPSQDEVLDPTKRPTLVLTTCNPRFSAAERLIVFAERVEPA